MPSFINLTFDQPLNRKLLGKHLLFTAVWTIGGILLFRLDSAILSRLYQHNGWISSLLPIVLIAMVVYMMTRLKWYYNLALLFYPVLMFFWFIPKNILKNGKIYLFSHYLNNVFDWFKRFKLNILLSFFLFLSLMLLAVTSNSYVKIFSLTVFSFFYFSFFINYIRKSFQPARLFGGNVHDFLKKFTNAEQPLQSPLISTLNEMKDDEKLDVAQNQLNRIKRFVFAKVVLEHLSQSLDGFKGKRAYVIFWIYQLGVSVLFTLLFFTVFNFLIYRIDSSHFMVSGSQGFFDFFYYTLKTITFSNIDNIRPDSILSKVSEIASFAILSIFILIILTSYLFSLNQEKVNENIRMAVQACNVQNEKIIAFAKVQLNTDIDKVAVEVDSIKTAIINIRKLLNRVI